MSGSEYVKKEWDYYRAHQDEFVSLYSGKYIVMSEKKVRGAFETFKEACLFGEANFESGKFMVQRCSPGEKDYTVRMYSGMRI
jgi:hypothetical protein